MERKMGRGRWKHGFRIAAANDHKALTKLRRTIVNRIQYAMHRAIAGVIEKLQDVIQYWR